MTTTALTIEDRIAARIDHDEAKGLAVSDSAGGLAFANVEQVMNFARMMAVASIAVPKHLRGNPGACVAVCIQAIEWRLSPFAVANKSYSVNDRLAYESQLVQAVILQRAPIKGRIKVEYTGEGDKRVCRVWADLKDSPGETVEYTSPEFGKIQPKNSPLWKSDPDQQQFYYSGRAMCRRHFPDVLLGVYAKDEIEDAPRDPARAKDVTPRSLTGKLDALASPVPAEAVEDAEVAEEGEQVEAKAEGQAEEGEAIAEQTATPDVKDAASGEPANDTEPQVDPNDPDFKRGQQDRRDGVKRCVSAAIREDETRFATWKAGFSSQAGAA